MQKKAYEYIIIGAGAAGLASAQYGARSGLATLVIDQSLPGGQAVQIAQVENYPGLYPATDGASFAAALKAQALAFGAEFQSAAVLSVDKIGRSFAVQTEHEEYISDALLIATGAVHRRLDIIGEREFTGRGVSYCAACDGPFFKDRRIIVAGGGDAACDEAVYLGTLSHQVTLVHRRNALRAQKKVAERVLSDSNVTVRFNTVIKEIRGTDRVKSVVLSDTVTGQLSEEETDAVFVFAGMIPQTDLVQFLPQDSAGYIRTDENMATAVPGLFCAGDVRSKPFRQLVTAAADGAVAAHQAELYIRSLKENGEKA